jgi:predicted lipoprotein with Yx(FWY)xxD motif
VPTTSIRVGLRGLAAPALVMFLAGACSAAATTAPTAAPVATAGPVATAAASTSPGGSAAAGAVVVNVATTSLGAVLTGPNGLTLYTHTGDTATSSTCTGGCATAWPPLAVSAGATATGGAGVTGTFGTLTRADGTTQVTYNGKPLYGWQGDTKPGDVTGDGVNGFAVAKP